MVKPAFPALVFATTLALAPSALPTLGWAQDAVEAPAAAAAPEAARAEAAAPASAEPARVQTLDEFLGKTAPTPPPTSQAGDRLVEWVIASGDNNAMPFAVVDKVAAVVSVYDAAGKLLGTEAALVGSAVGDDSTPGIGDRELQAIKPEERTTPAGRFVAGFGPSQGLGKVLWVDFHTAISMHAVVTANKAEKRLERLATPTPDDNRISYGCINVPAQFYKDVVEATFLPTHGIVYILPEVRTMAEVFPSYGVYAEQKAALASR